jgi:alpha(1,3/1,4) fucosyltransferase
VSVSAAVTLFIDPPSRHFEHERLFDLRTGRFAGVDLLTPYAHLRERLTARGVRVRTADALERGEALSAHNVYVSLGMRKRYRSLAARDDVALSAFLTMECPIVEPELYSSLGKVSRRFRRILSYATTEALLPFTGVPIEVGRFRIPQAFDAVHEEIWSRADRRLLTMINANKRPRLGVAELYTERLRAVEFFSRRGEIDLYGVGWDGPPYRVGTRLPGALQRRVRTVEQIRHSIRPDPLLVAAARAWRGRVEDKADVLGGYRFAICFENMVLEGWITEKIFDCFFAGTIPVYRGAPDIADWVPRECFIDARDFDGYDGLRQHLLALGPNELRAHREAARDFIESDRFRPFSKETYVEMFVQMLETDAGVRL